MPTSVSVATARRWLTLSCLGVATLAAPLTVLAQTMVAPTTPAASVSHHTAYSSAMMRRETLDQRISSLHSALKITPTEEADWAKVANVMRRNDSDMQKLVAERQSHVPHELNAVDDLKTYQKFTQAHVDGLKDLIASFETLYTEMPDSQKTIADHVFAKYGRKPVVKHVGAPAQS